MNILERVITSLSLYPLWRIGRIERAFFRFCRWLSRAEQNAFLVYNFGFDISKWQGFVDFAKMLAYGAKFLILRCAYGVTQDERFTEYMQSAPVYFKALSAYAFYDPVYSPDSQANKVLSVLAPYKNKIRRVWLDLEFWWAGNYSDPKHWKIYRDIIKNAGYKIGWYSRATWWDSRVGTYAAEFASDPLWAAQYNTALTLIPKGWKELGIPAMLWQNAVKTVGKAAGVSSEEIDNDLWNDEYSFYDEWNSEIVSEDIITYPFDGVKRITGRRNGSDFILNFLDPQKIRFEVVHDSNLRRPSSFAIERGADFAWNGDVWNKYEPAPYKPMGFAVSDSEIIMWRTSFVPSLDLPTADIFYEGERGTQVTSGFRYIIQNSRPNSYLSGTTEEYIDVHPRSAKGVDVNGHIMMLTVDGRTAENRGMTLLELANLLCEFQCVTAFDSDSGGSSVDVMNGIVRNKPSDGTERPVVQTILAYAGELNMTIGTVISTTHELSMRPLHQISSTSFLKIPMNTEVGCLEMWTAPETTTLNKAGELWAKVIYGGRDGWVALFYNGVKYGKFTLSVPAEKKLTVIQIVPPAGSITTLKYSDGTEETRMA